MKDEDILHGIGIFLSYALTGVTQDYNEKDLKDRLDTGGYNELLFNVLLGSLYSKDTVLDEKDIWLKDKFKARPFSITTMGQWLCNERIHALGEDCLYQYDLPLERWYSSFEGNEEFFKKPKNKLFVKPCKKALWRIHHFDSQKEGDTPRTRCVIKVRKMLDERDFIPEFKQMWEDVKAGKIEIENPWER